MSLPSGGFITDEVYGDVLLFSGMQNTLFRAVVKQVTNVILSLKEVSTTLTAPEKLLQADLNSNNAADMLINRIIDFIRKDTKWTARGMWLASSDINLIINAAWENILKKYS